MLVAIKLILASKYVDYQDVRFDGGILGNTFKIRIRIAFKPNKFYFYILANSAPNYSDE